MLPDLHIGFSRGRSGALVFPSLSECSTVYCDPHSQRVGIVNKAEIDVFLELSCFFSDPVDVAVRAVKFKDTESRIVVARGWTRRGVFVI